MTYRGWPSYYLTSIESDKSPCFSILIKSERYLDPSQNITTIPFVFDDQLHRIPLNASRYCAEKQTSKEEQKKKIEWIQKFFTTWLKMDLFRESKTKRLLQNTEETLKFYLHRACAIVAKWWWMLQWLFLGSHLYFHNVMVIVQTDLL